MKILFFYLFNSTCHYIANIQHFMLSKLGNCYNLLMIFKGFLHLIMHKQCGVKTICKSDALIEVKSGGKSQILLQGIV